MVVYREHPVPPALRWALACGWTLRAGPRGVLGWPVLPDAHMDIVATAGGVQLAGPATVVQLSRLGPGEAVAGVRLRPGTATALLGVPASAVRDEHVDLAALWPALARRHGWDADAIAASGPGGRLRALYALLATRLPDAAPPDDLVRHAVARIRHGAPSVTSLAAETGLTTRQLLRRFDAAVGYGPKRLQRIVRLQRGLELHRREPAVPLAALAAQAGYADQAHLTRDWHALTGATPARLLATRVVDVAPAPAEPGRRVER
ncbi:helix-turn-helix domain-containing protein [Paraconexibacter sp. AEG42_29]|uniref:helix-turn-helix domain-containing protein n=1 Tax=Paraconexibacter sp. AEG42_29 TaxID=2997339 RepID=UPI00339D54FA